ncbi:hypothetical protein [Streptomyces purpurascens]|uniref:Integral membrane protein n=1 Tax=Streptomyces purpurascens TaxID=1924 RepID=A0ABZ1MP04_STREF|nr:hypothetical protein [Streptomyces purpurascens]MCE7044879.1 hypothetical protein [Streptomyces purpurascens]GHA14440.1 hypothetical protein GCM10010303_25810 [Streptomyces purpurascens]
MKYDVLQVLGMVLLVVCAQALVRLLVDEGERGLLDGLPGGFLPLLLTYAVLTATGVLLTGWAHSRAKALGRR